ncbi:hypothetical protein MMC17_000472 [Xylographa soralifera]|nr:hypothetical protein [Xylographa soralifera]
MPDPIDWNNAPEEEVDYGGEEDLDVAEDEGLFFGEGPMEAPDLDSSTEKGDNDISMGNNDVAEVYHSPKALQPLFRTQDNKTGEIDDEDEEELLKEILTKGAKYFEEHKVLDAKITKTEVAIHVEPKQNDGEGGGEAMDISDDSGPFEELDENGAEILGIEKDLQDIEAQEDKAQKTMTDSDSANKALATLKAALRSPPKYHGAKFDPKDGPIVSCEMENDRNLSPFGHVNFYPNKQELQAEFSDHADVKHRQKKVSFIDAEISPKNTENSDSKHSGTEKPKVGGTTLPFKSHELPTIMPSQYSGGLPSPPLTEVDSVTRRNAIGGSSYVSPPLSPESTNKQASCEAAKDATGYLFGEKPPWYREQIVTPYLFGEKPPWYKEREPLPLPKENQDSNAVALSNHYKRKLPFTSGNLGFRGWDRSAKTTTATSSWPPWMTAIEIKSLERKGIDGLSIASLQERWGTSVPTRVNMVSIPQGQGLSKAQGIGPGQSAFGYETSNDPPKQPNTEKDKHIRNDVARYRLPAHNVVSTITTQSAPQTRYGITLVRPARERIVLLEQPFELERLLNHVRMLYPVHPLTPEGRYDHLSFRLIRVNVSDQNRPTTFEQIASMSDAYLDGGVLQDHYQSEIMPRLMAVTDDQQVWVIRTFTRVWVQDGRDTSNFFKLDLVFPLPQAILTRDPEYFFAQYDLTPDPPGCIKAQFDAGVVALMGGDVVNNANVQVDRYKKEWLEWRSKMDDETFLRSFLWRIDDPTINVYPKNWNPHQSFEESEEEREARRRRRQQEAQDALDAAGLISSGPRLRNSTAAGQDSLIGSQITLQLNEAERRRVAERDQEFNRQEQQLAQWAAQLETRDRQLGERTTVVERLITELGQQRQTLERTQQTFETANNQTVERTTSLNIQHQTLRNAGTCSLDDGYVAENSLDRLEHVLMHQQAGHVVQNIGPPTGLGGVVSGRQTTGPPIAPPPTASGLTAPLPTAPPPTAPTPIAGPTTAGPGIAPHPSGDPTGGPVGLNTNGLDPQSGLDPHAAGTFWICRCGTNLNSVKKKRADRGSHYAKCHYNDAHLRFRGGKTKTPEEKAKEQAKAAADALKKGRKRKKDPDPANSDASDEEAGQSKKKTEKKK